MNLGLDNDEKGRHVLEPTDPFYGKLAFFDEYVLHWNSEKNMIDLIKNLSKLRTEYLSLLRKEYFHQVFESLDSPIGYIYWNGRNGIIVVANEDFDENKNVDIDLGYYTWKGNHKITRFMKNYVFEKQSREVNSKASFTIEPGEVLVASIE